MGGKCPSFSAARSIVGSPKIRGLLAHYVVTDFTHMGTEVETKRATRTWHVSVLARDFLLGTPKAVSVPRPICVKDHKTRRGLQVPGKSERRPRSTAQADARR